MTIPTLPPIQGYNGEGGYRRNTPDLRTNPSAFEDDGKTNMNRPDCIVPRSYRPSSPTSLFLPPKLIMSSKEGEEGLGMRLL